FDHSASGASTPALIQAMALERRAKAPSVRCSRHDVPWSLESITLRCLAPEPQQRYQSGEELAEDLRRFLDDRPLKYAPELSRAERLRKWARRHPRLTSSASVAAAAMLLLLASGLALAGVAGHLASAREHLAVAHAQDRMRDFHAG